MADYATLLRDNVTLACRSIDRIFLQGYVPKLQSVGQVCRFLNGRGFNIPSSAAFGKIGDGYVDQIHRFARTNDVPLIRFEKGECKEAIARPLIDAAAREGGQGRVVLIGTAQEKASAWKSWKAKGQEHLAHPHMEWRRQMVFVNHFYLYLWDPEWGPAFWKTNAYGPYPIWIWLNGHEWAKRQLEKAGIGYEALDNGFASCENPAALQRICDRLGPGAVKSFFWRWQRRLPSPFTPADLRAGYTYELAFRQFEISDTRVFDRPASGRAFFEGVIRDHLDVGRPDQVAIVFDRKITKRTPGTFRTKVVTKGVDPQLCCYYRSARMKQYFKEHRALRTETVISNTSRLRDRAVRQPGQLREPCGALARRPTRGCAPRKQQTRIGAPDVVTLQRVTRPSKTLDGLHAPGLRFGDPRVMALFSALCGFCHLAAGFTNRQLTELVGALLHQPYTGRQATYDLRRLIRKEVIERIDGTNRYLLTPLGRRVAVLFTKAYGRVLSPGLAVLDPALPDDIAQRHPLATAWRRFDNALDDFIHRQLIAA